MTDSLLWLTASAVLALILWAPYTLERIFRVGLGGALGHAAQSGTAGFEQPDETPAAWARRAYAGHMNLLESLPVFAALVLTAHLLKVEGTALAAMVFFYARLGHYVIYLFGIPAARTLLFFVAFGAQCVIAYAILAALGV